MQDFWVVCNLVHQVHVGLFMVWQLVAKGEIVGAQHTQWSVMKKKSDKYYINSHSEGQPGSHLQ